MPYGPGTYGTPSRSPALRNYLDQRQANPYQTGNRYGMGGGMSPMPQPSPLMPPMNGGMTPPPSPLGRIGANGMGLSGRFSGPPAPSGPWTPTSPYEKLVAGLGKEDSQRHADYGTSLYAGPDFKGRHEMNQLLLSQYADFLSRQNAQPPIDYSGSAEIADVFNNQRSRMEDRLAAQGFGGSGIMAGAEASLAGRQGAAMGEFYRRSLAERQARDYAAEQQFMNWARALQTQGLQRNWGEQDQGGFFDDVLGAVGGVIGNAIPGVGGALGGLVGGLFDKDDPIVPAGYQGIGTEPVDWDEDYAWGGPY